MSGNEPEIQSEIKETQRLEAFSDGVFAVATTLLVLEIRLPAGETQGGLLNQLLSLWPTYLAYLVSFLTIGIMWANHDAMLRDIKRSDRLLVLLNVLLLMVITFLNFPTVLLAEYLQKPEANVAAMFYSGTFLVIAGLWNTIWRYAISKPSLFGTRLDPVWQKQIMRQYSRSLLFYLIAFIASIFSPLLSVGIDLALAVFYALAGTPRVNGNEQAE